MKIKKIMIAAIASIASIIAILFAAVEIVYFLCLLDESELNEYYT